MFLISGCTSLCAASFLSKGGIIMAVLDELQPQRVFYYFEEICKIPHGSYHVEDLAKYIVTVAKSLNLLVKEDKYHNILIKKPASPGYENAPAIILQGHMDMVCEKEDGVQHDFLVDGLMLEKNEEYVYAAGTTLGGDDGIALAYGLAILEDNTLKHPPLEVLFTSEEEVGMNGAIGFDISSVSGNYLINLDSEEEGIVLISSAGGESVTLSKTVAYEEPKGVAYQLMVSGLAGGHSGADIHLGKANANVLLARVLSDLSEEYEIRIANIHGGSKHNAIPQQAECIVYLKGDNAWKGMELVKEAQQLFQKEYEKVESSIKVTLCLLKEAQCKAYSMEFSKELIELLYIVPDGVYAMSNDMQGLVESSENFAVISEEKEQISLLFSLRSQNTKGLEQMKKELQQISEKTDFKMTLDSWYPSWEYEPNSKLRELLLSCYEEQYHKKMRVEAIHAGLECGILASKKKLDIISIGPDILGIHTPRERLNIASTKRTYELLVSLLERCIELK